MQDLLNKQGTLWRDVQAVGQTQCASSMYVWTIAGTQASCDPLADRWEVGGVSAEIRAWLVLKSAVEGNKVNKSSDSVGITTHAQFDELSADELRAYSAKICRWRRDTYLTIEDPMF